MQRGLRWIAALIFALLALTACAGADDTRGVQEPGDVDYDSTEESAADSADSDEFHAEGPESDLAGDGADSPERQVITTAYAAVEVDDTVEAVAQLLSRTTGYGGYVEDRNERRDMDGNHTWASLTLRLPAENLPEMLEQLEDLGEVSEISESAQDVTGAVRDLDARIGALETSVERLLDIMSEADTAEDLLRAEQELSQRQASLESLQAERNALGDQVAMSTLQAELSTEPITTVEADGFMGGLQSGWNGLVSVANALLVGLGTLVPWIPVIAAPILVIWLLVRWGRRRSQHTRVQAGAAAAPQPAQPKTAHSQDADQDYAGSGDRIPEGNDDAPHSAARTD